MGNIALVATGAGFSVYNDTTQLNNPPWGPFGVSVFTADISPNGAYAAVGTDANFGVDTYVGAWNTNNLFADPGTEWDLQFVDTDATGNVAHVRFSPNNTWLAVAQPVSPYILIYATATWTKLANPATLPTTAAERVAWSADSTRLAVRANNQITVYDTSDWSLVHQSTLAASSNNILLFNSDGTRLILGAASGSNYIQALDTTTWTAVSDPTGTNTAAFKIADRSSDGTCIAATGGTTTGTIPRAKAWTGATASDPSTWTSATFASSSFTTVDACRFIPGSNKVALGNALDSDVKVYDLDAAGAVVYTFIATGGDPAADIGFFVQSSSFTSDAATTFNLTNPTSTTKGDIINNLEQSLSFTTSLTLTTYIDLLTKLHLANQDHPSVITTRDASTTANFASRVMQVIDDVVGETVSLSAVEDLSSVVADVLERLVLAGTATSLVQLVKDVVDAFVFHEALLTGAVNDASDVIDLVDSSDFRVLLYDAVTTAFQTSELLSSFVSVFAEAPEAFQLSSDASNTAVMSETVMEAFRTGGVLILADGQVYQTWCVNAETGAASRYGGYAFESLARVGEHGFGASDEGLFLLEGDDDAGETIGAFIKTGLIDFGIDELKRLDEVAIGFSATGQLVLKTTTSRRGAGKTERWYRLKQAGVPGNDREGRFEPGRGVESRYWQFELVNVDGADFELGMMKMTVVPLSRRV